ncbi:MULTISPECIES: ParA family protein [Cupriavidus]|uniref:ATPase involved in chromosome partitioning n=1 Tax=Cupriavidus taiwanensis TaxID=164546 RepID=A0A375JBI2_9BURK|nr:MULTISPECIES: AAA family ATPase [Cupriavidus]SPS02555.1 ATPase involved in chromosome partitioning [Cupriavidus taiwanensis]
MANFSQPMPMDPTVTLAEISDFADVVTDYAGELRDQILAPRPRKTAPVFTTSEIAELCGLSRQQVLHMAKNGDGVLPEGQMTSAGRGRTFTLAEARNWVQQVSDIYQTPLVAGPTDFEGKIIITSQLKGGSAKTTTTMCLAQGLSLRGRKVLVVDLDPQASLSELCGLYAEKEVFPEDTVLPFIYDQMVEGGLADKVQSTYWDGLDLIPAHTELVGAEYHLPAMQMKLPGFKFWQVLREGLKPLRKQYDYIILDTSPSLSYLNLNALMAADAMVMPMVPENLDFFSSLSFWRLFSDVAKSFMKYEADKKYDFVSVLLTRVSYGPTSAAPVVRTWAQGAYRHWLAPFEVPASSVMSSGALAFTTVFDISSSHSQAKSLQRVRQPLVDYCRWVDDLFVKQWRSAQ